MKSPIIAALGAFVLFSLNPVLTLADESASFEIGGGFAMLDTKSPDAVAVLKIEYNDLATRQKREGVVINLEMGFGSNGYAPTVPHADIVATFVRARSDNSPDGRDMFGIQSGTINYQRELAVDLNHSLSVSLLGVWVNSQIPVSENVKFMIRAIVDLASIGFAERVSADPNKLSNVFGWTPSAEASVGFDFFERFHIMLGERAMAFFGATTGKVFNDSEAPQGTAGGVISRTQLKTSVDVTRNFSLFFEGSYALFAYNAKETEQEGIPLLSGGTTPDEVHTNHGVWQLLFGVAGKW